MQVLLLLHPAVRSSPTIRIALARLHRANVLEAEETALLTEADRLWRTVQGMLRITVGPKPPDSLPLPALDALQRAAGDGWDTAAFRARLDDMAARVRTVFNHYVGVVG